MSVPSRVLVIGIVGAASTFAAMVATPLARPGGTSRRCAAAFVVGGLAITTFDRLRIRWGPGPAARSASLLLALGWSAEVVGTRTGLPFGRYAYTDRLRPRVGGVPVLVPLAWFAMAAPARDVAHAVLGERSTPVGRIVAGAAALTAWDLFLDPQMTREGYWTWARAGRYRGIPLTNLVGWFLVGAAAMVVLEVTVPAQEAPDSGLVAEYGGVAAMETIGFAAFFRDSTVAVVGGTAMVPLAVAAFARVIRPRPVLDV